MIIDKYLSAERNGISNIITLYSRSGDKNARVHAQRNNKCEKKITLRRLCIELL
jgi:hypothetical protein